MNDSPPSSMPLLFSLENARQQPVIYITDDPALNVLRFNILNNTSGAISLKGGTPIPECQQKKGGPSCLYLSFQGLVSDTEFKAVTISAPGWQSTWFPSVKQWGLTPSTDISLPAQQSITFKITKLIANESPASGFLSVDYFNIGSIASNNDQIKVFLQNPPSSKRQELNLNHGFLESNLVMVSNDPENPVNNTLKIFLANPDPTHPVVPSTTPWGKNPPVFILSFVYGENPGYGALSTVKRASHIMPTAPGGSGNNWQVVPDTQGSSPSWQLLPQNHDILGTGQNAAISITLDTIVSFLQPGLTLLYLQYANIPGYNDGFYSLLIQKEEPVTIKNFYLETSWRLETAAPASVTLHWEVDNAVSLELRSEFGAQDVTGMTSWTSPEPVKKTTRFTLHASGQDDHFDDANTDFNIITLKVTPNLASELKPKTYQSVAYSQKWDRAYFTSPDGSFMTFDTQTNQPLYSTNISSQYLTSITASPSLSPDKDRIYMMDGGADYSTLLVVDVDNQGKPTIIKKIQMLKYSTDTLAVSPDGQTLYFDGGITWTIGFLRIADYTLQYLGTWNEFNGVGDLIISPDGRTLYASSEGNLVVGIDTSSHTLVGQVKLGPPSQEWQLNMAITPDSKQVYIPNANMSTTTAIFPDENWRTEIVPTNVTSGLVATSAVDIVFALITNSDSLAVIDTGSRKITQTIPFVMPIPTDGGLVGAAMSPDGSKLYVTDNMGNFVIAALEINVIDPLPKSKEMNVDFNRYGDVKT